MTKFILRNAFGLQGSALDYLWHAPLSVAAWWKLWRSHGYRNWRRGYRDEDAKSLMKKLSVRPKPGAITYLTRREMNVYRTWYETDRGRNGLAA